MEKVANIKAILKKEARVDGQQLVMLRITYDRKAAYMSTGIYITEKDFNKRGSLDKNDWVRKHAMRLEYNKSIERLIRKAQQAALDNPGMSAAHLKELLQGKVKASDFVEYLEEDLLRRERLYKTGQLAYSTYQQHAALVNKIKDYTPVLPFTRITTKWVEGFIQHFRQAGNKASTISLYLGLFRTVARDAVKAGLLKELPEGKLPPRTPEKKKEFLSLEEVKLLRDAALPGKLSPARDLFLMQFYCQGARVGSMLLLRWENIREGRIRYQERKTGKWYSVPVTEQIQTILNRNEGGVYVLPILEEGLNVSDPKLLREGVARAITSANYRLKQAASYLGIAKQVSTHTARHTFTSLAVRQAVPAAVVQAMLGHASLGQTQAYMGEFAEGELDTAASAIFKNV